jgi:transducin (beta)-like 1
VRGILFGLHCLLQGKFEFRKVLSVRTLTALRSKDSVVQFWNLPVRPKDNASYDPYQLEAPMTVVYPPKDDQGDLTSLDWNVDGSLLAIGSYDSTLRICTVSGNLYLSDPTHQVYCVRIP